MLNNKDNGQPKNEKPEADETQDALSAVERTIGGKLADESVTDADNPISSEARKN